MGTELLLEAGGKIITPLFFIVALNMCHSRLKNGGAACENIKIGIVLANFSIDNQFRLSKSSGKRSKQNH